MKAPLCRMEGTVLTVGGDGVGVGNSKLLAGSWGKSAVSSKVARSMDLRDLRLRHVEEKPVSSPSSRLLSFCYLLALTPLGLSFAWSLVKLDFFQIRPVCGARLNQGLECSADPGTVSLVTVCMKCLVTLDTSPPSLSLGFPLCKAESMLVVTCVCTVV